MLSSLVACNTRYGFRDKIKINAKEETRVNKPLKIPTVLVRSEPNSFLNYEVITTITHAIGLFFWFWQQFKG